MNPQHKHWLNEWEEEHEDVVMKNLITKNKEETKRMAETLVAQEVLDLFGGELTIQEDTDSVDFDKPLRGKYIARIVKLVRYAGESEKCENGIYDMFSLSLQIEETVDGDRGENRYLSKTYSNLASEKFEQSEEENQRKLMNDLHTAGVKFTFPEGVTNRVEFYESIASDLTDQLVKVSAYPTKAKKQAVRFVNKFKLAKKQEEASGDDL